ncbi:MraY family glycosyltransferase [Gimesia panareensis]|uniref:MraY family glycosyltransferase n=1 Tax=Gimesia panareensis TaxID=2527978 RepID=UPI0011881D9B|nr:glycosyltransferase family 4 protein [Gimesia panareensis]QDU48745.1 WbpL_WbcO_like glycosyltransferase [Gimesia panareensis]
MVFDSVITSSLVLFGVLLATVAGTLLMIRLASVLGLVQKPTSRCSHIQPTPRGGGLAFVLTSLLTMTVCYWNEISSGSLLTVLLCGGALIATIGFCDDLYQLSIKKRLGAQILIIAASLYTLLPAPTLELWGFQLQSDWLCWGVTTLALAWWLNLFNFMDGIDGLAGVEATGILVGAGTLIYYQYPGEQSLTLSLMWILAAALIGFIQVNWAPARIFMGDVGSTFLGYMLGMLAVSTIFSGTLNLWVWLILPGVFWVDATFTLLRRMLRGDRWYQAHKSHTYQRVSRYLEEPKGKNLTRKLAHRKVTQAVLALNVCWLFPLATVALLWPAWGLPLVLIAWAPLVALAVVYGAGKPGNIPLLTRQDSRAQAYREELPLKI